MESLSIAHLTPFYHPTIGGVENVVRNIAERSIRAGHSIDVVTTRRHVEGDSPAPRYEELNGVKIHRLPTYIYYSFGSVMRGLTTLLKKLKPDIIHTHVYRHPHSTQALLLKNRIDTKVVLHSHGPFPPATETPMTWQLYYRLFDSIIAPLSLPQYDAIVAVTPLDKEELISRGAPREKIVQIPNGVDEIYLHNDESPTEFRRDRCITEEHIVLSIGRIHPQKRIELLIRATSLLEKDVKDRLKVVIAGPVVPRYAKNLRTLTSKENAGGQVLFTGPLNFNERCQAYKAADICISTNPYESFGLSLLEAMASGTPVIAMRGGGQQFLVEHGGSGILADPTPSAIASVLETLLTHPEKRLKLSRGGKQAAQNYAWDVLLPKYLKLYRDIMKRN